MLRAFFTTKPGKSVARWCRSVIDKHSRPLPASKDKASIRDTHPFHSIHRIKQQLAEEDATTVKMRKIKMIIEFDGTNYFVRSHRGPTALSN